MTRILLFLIFSRSGFLVAHSATRDVTSAVYNYSNLGIDEYISVYPNPVAGNGILKLTAQEVGSGKTQIQIYDLRGALIHMIQSESLPGEITLPSLNPGVYFMNILGEERTLKGIKIQVL